MMWLRLPDERDFVHAVPDKESSAAVVIAPFQGTPIVSHASMERIAPQQADPYPDLLSYVCSDRRIIYMHEPLSQCDASPEEHMETVRHCVEYLRTLPAASKIVLSRTQTIPVAEAAHMAGIDLPASKDRTETSLLFAKRLFLALAVARADACVFMFGHPSYGIWIGASPELLLMERETKNGSIISSASLAGTMAHTAGAVTSKWDNKNIEEQKIVTDSITETYRRNGLQPAISGPVTVKAGNVCHLRSMISAPSPATRSIEDTLRLAQDLSPTPALGGYPREQALAFIRGHEKADRGCYGGYFGIAGTPETRLYVNIRSLRLFPEHGVVRMYAGGGITAHSDPMSEYRETENKLRWLSALHTLCQSE